MKTTNKSSPAYELDFYGWTQEQAKLLQEQKWSQLDIPNLVEEIEALGRQERQELENRLGILLGHLLKWEFQSDKRSRSWFATIREQRRRIERLLKKSSSLQPYLPEALENGYQDALDLAVRETSLSYKTFPPECPYSLEQIFNNNLFPGETFDPEEYR
ncbi:DUF29 domain-containing protein [Coleofasciculus sp. E2-BRE-01]|uniref:DUF29 domain-containing protein n=1 Tax=Coleofasciculus sp. E2-BRE-01 TaxID=3069524 RepID=UPI0033025001